MSETQDTGTTQPPPEQLPTERAEEIVDRLGQQLSNLASQAALELQRAAARMREEAEDMWAEARDLAHRWRQPSA
jgi:hypothetical protein